MLETEILQKTALKNWEISPFDLELGSDIEIDESLLTPAQEMIISELEEKVAGETEIPSRTEIIKDLDLRYSRNGSLDLVKMYIQDTMPYPTISEYNQQIAVFQRFEKLSNQINDLKSQLTKNNLNGHTHSTQIELAETQDILKYEREAFMYGHAPLVISIAKKYTNFRLPLIDLIQAGNEGLMKDCDRYDYNQGFKFGTYATWWIRQSILRTIANESRIIRLPVHMFEDVQRTMRANYELSSKLGREPTYTEIAQELGLTEQKVAQSFEVAQDAGSLNKKIGEEKEDELLDIIPDTHKFEDTVEVDLDIKYQVNELLILMNKLDNKSRYIILERFGLIDGIPKTFSQVAKIIGTSKESVRKSAGNSIRQLRELVNSNKVENAIPQQEIVNLNSDDYIESAIEQYVLRREIFLSEEPDEVKEFSNNYQTKLQNFENLLRLSHQSGEIGESLRNAIRAQLTSTERMIVMLHLQPREYADGKSMTFEEIDEIYSESKRKPGHPAKDIYKRALLKLYNHFDES